MPLPPSLKVTGRFGMIANDGLDPDDEPDYIYCNSGRIFLEPLGNGIKIVSASPAPVEMGITAFEATVDADGYMTWRGLPYVKTPDLTSEYVDPRVTGNNATHMVRFRDMKADGTAVKFEDRRVRIATDTAIDGVCDLVKLLPSPTGTPSPIYRGEPGIGIAGMAVQASGTLEVDLTNGETIDAGLLPVGPGGSNVGVAGYVNTPGPTQDAITAKIPAVIAAPGDGRDAVDTRVVTLQERTMAVGRKLRGGNIAPKPGKGWQHLFAEWDWDNWIQPQIDRAVALGLNSIRLIGAPRCVLVNPSGMTKISQAQYDAHWAQVATYCLERGLSLYPCLVTKWDFYDVYDPNETYQEVPMTDSVKASAAALAAFPNVVGFDLFQEGDSRTGTPWAASTAYAAVGQHVNLGGRSYKVTTAGTSAASGGPTGTGTGITDGTVVWDYDGIPVMIDDVLAMMAAVRAVANLPLTMSFSVYADNIGWIDNSYMWAKVFSDPLGADFVDVHAYSGAAVPSDLDYLIALTGKPVMVGEYGASQDLTSGDQVARFTAAAALHNRRGVLGSFLWALADQDVVSNNQFGVWDNTGFTQGASPLSVASGQRAALTALIPRFRIADPTDLPTRGINLLTPPQARPRGLAGSRAGWAASANTSLVSDPRGLGFAASGAGNASATIRPTGKDPIPVLPETWYRLECEVLAFSLSRTIEFVGQWCDSAGATISSTATLSGADGPITPLKLSMIQKSPAGAAFWQPIVRAVSAPAFEEHIVMNVEIAPV